MVFLPTGTPVILPTMTVEATPLPTRLPPAPGQIMEYRIQSGDTLEAVAAHFNTKVKEIRQANPGLPRIVTTLFPGGILRVPMYFAPFAGTPFQILPDSEVVGSPSVSQFPVREAVDAHDGWLKGYSAYALDQTRAGWNIVQGVARDYSLHPRLLLALLEYRSQALTRKDQSPEEMRYPLGETGEYYGGLAVQLMWAAERLNEGYYGWRTGALREIELADGRITRPDPWQNAGTIAVQYLFAYWYGQEDFDRAVSPEGFAQTYRMLFGDPFAYAMELFPGNLEQPPMQLPFEPGKIWLFTGGPHPVWGGGLPWAAIDFAPPSEVSGCVESEEWVLAAAGGTVVRSEPALVVLDLDSDGDERTGWTILYYHLAEKDRAVIGSRLIPGGRIGHPSCEGGRATGTNFHIARRYNGEWISAGGVLAFNLSGWIAGEGEEPYEGTLSYYLDIVLHAHDFVGADNRISLPTSSNPTP